MTDATPLLTKLAQFDSLPKDHLIQRTEWGSIDFRAASKDIDSIYEIVEILRDLPLDRLPSNAIQAISDQLDSVLVWINREHTFTLSQGNPAASRDEIVNNMSVVQQGLYVATHQWIPFLAYLKGDIPAQLRQITSSVALAETARAGFEQYLDGSRSELDKIIQATREASAEAGVGQFTSEFLTEAGSRDSDADSWLKRSVSAAFVTLGTAVGFFFIHAPETQYGVVQYTTSKVVILAMLIAITAWCAGNFKANKHQATVNRFKAHALRTFQAFVQASDNETVKNAVLLETTRAIFAQSQTGYLKGDIPNEGSSRIVEIIKGNADHIS